MKTVNLKKGVLNTKSAVAIPTVSGIFPRPEFNGFGQGAANRKAADMTDFMFRHPAHPMLSKEQKDGFISQSGD